MSEYQPRRSVKRRGSARRPAGRNGGRTLAIALVAIFVVVVFLFVRSGASRLFSRAESAAPATTTAGVSAAKAGTSGHATTSAGSKTEASQPGSSTATSAGGTNLQAWQTADPSWMGKYKGELVCGFKTEPGFKAVALTFDDGPNFRTPYVIKTLKQYGGEATFFDTGKNLIKPEYRTQPQLVWNAGFEIGNHTKDHTINNISAVWHRTYATDLTEIQEPDTFVKPATGRNTVWVRPMGGLIDATGMKAAEDTGHLVINWTIDSGDSTGQKKTPDYLYKVCTTNVHPGDVILLHVTHPESMAALPRICRTLTQEGFKLVTVSDLAEHSTGAILQKIPQ